MQFQGEATIKYTDDLVKLDQILVGGLLVVISSVKTNKFGQKVLTCGIVGARQKKRNKMTVIIPDQTPVTTYA